jgi:hypothetical protein
MREGYVMKKYIGYAVVFAALILSIVTAGVKTSYAANTVLTDDFSDSTSTSKNWDIIGINNTPSIKGGAMQLTSSGRYQVGTIWLKDAIAKSIKPPYTVTFRFLIDGVDKSNVGADGIVFMFNKKQNTSPVTGGGMGFQSDNGYGVEFDTYSNEFDPSVDHISLFKNNPDHSVLKSNLLAQINDTTFEDAQWHDVRINVNTNNVKVYLDKNADPSINWDGTIDSAYDGIGITASTGYFYNRQTIDNVVITKPANVTGVDSTFATGAYPAGTIIPIQITFNDTIQVTGAPILELNTRHNATYASGTGTDTLTFNYTVQADDNLSSLNYHSNTSLALNGGTLLDSAGNIANLSLANVTNRLGASKIFTLDNTLPIVTASISSGDPIANTVTLNLTASDGGSGKSQMRFSNDNSKWTDWETFAGSRVYSVPDSTSVKYIYTQVRDKAKNIGIAPPIIINPPKVAAAGGPLTFKENNVFNGQLSFTNDDKRTDLKFIMISNPAKGTVTLSTTTVDGMPKVTFIYTPKANVYGTDSFSFKLSDGVSYSNVAKVDLNITHVNIAPVAINRALEAVEDVPINFTVTGTDADSATLTFAKVGNGQKGTVALVSPSGIYSYTPNLNENGSDSFNFTVSDGLLTSTGMVNVTIKPVNDAPVATNATITTLEDTPTIDGQLSASDVDKDPLTYHLFSNGKKGNVIINLDGSFIYMPYANMNGTDTFTFIAKDNSLLNSNIATVNVNITPVNDAPSFKVGLNQKVTSASVEQNVYGWATAISKGPSDESGQTVDFIMTGIVTDNSDSDQPLFKAQPIVSPEGNLSYTPNDNVSGSATIKLKLHDNGGDLNNAIDTSVEQQFVISISNAYVTIKDFTLSAPDWADAPSGWTKGPITVTANVYSSVGGVDVIKWAPGNHNETYFTGPVTHDDIKDTSNGSFTVETNDEYTIYAAKGANTDLKVITIGQIDNVAPILELRDNDPLAIEAGTPFMDPGADVTDNSLAHPIIISAITSNVDPNAVGDYTMTYAYTDHAGNQALSVTRSVHVKDTIAPVITLLGDNPLFVPANTPISALELQAHIIDNSINSITNSYSGTLNLKTPGKYDLVYNATDGFNPSSVTRTVYVTDIIPPTITVAPPEGWTVNKTTISATFDGTGSEIVSKKWAEGAQSLDYFASTDPAIIHTFDGSFDVTANGSYTIFAEDQYGNKAVTIISISNIDKSAPIGSILINQGDLFTASNEVTLQLSAADAQSGVVKMKISNDPTDSSFTDDLNWMSYWGTSNWNLLNGDGTKTVYVRFKDAVGNVSDIIAANIVVDTIGHPDLSQLNLEDASLRLSPGFDPAITNYTIIVPSSVSSIHLLPKSINNLNMISVMGGGLYTDGIVYSNELSNTIDNGNNLITLRISTANPDVFRDYKINVYKLSSMNNITGFLINGLAADPEIDITHHTVSLSVYSQTSLIGLVPQITVSHGATIELAAGNTNDFTAPVHYLVKAEDGSPIEWTVSVNSVITSSVELNNLSLEGFAFAFDPAITSYSVEVGPLFNQLAVTAVTADPLAAVAITYAGSTYNGAIHNVPLSAGDNLIHVVVSAQNGLMTKSYDLLVHKLSAHINPSLGYAASNADGTEAILVFKEALDLSTLTKDKFAIQIGDNNNVNITSVTYDQGSSAHPVVHLKLNGAIPGTNNWMLNITGVRTAAGADVNITAFPITSMAKVQQLNTLIDPLNDGVHMDNIIMYMQTKQDVTGDGVFDRFDIQYLLDQI